MPASSPSPVWGRLRTYLLLSGLAAAGLTRAALSASTLVVPSPAYPTIQAGLDAAAPGDTVVVADGVYSGPGNTDLDFRGKPVTLRSAGGSAACVIDCGSAARGLFFHTGEPPAAVVDGFTIANGSAPVGGGICVLGGRPTISHCLLLNNTAATGGGIYLDRFASPSVSRCEFRGNTGRDGGGMALVSSGPTLSGCIFTGNRAAQGGPGSGGGIFLNGSGPIIDACVFTGNTASLGGGLASTGGSGPLITACAFNANQALNGTGGGIGNDRSEVVVVNSTFVGNSGAGIYNSIARATVIHCTLTGNADGMASFASSFVRIFNSILWGNAGADLRDSGNPQASNCDLGALAVAGIVVGSANLSADPQFVRVPNAGPDGWGDNPATPADESANDDFGDLHLHASSPCIDHGSTGVPFFPAVDKDGLRRVEGGTPDLGAFELHNQGPSADAGPDQTVTVPHDGDPATRTASFVLDGSGSHDPDADTLRYEWQEGMNVLGSEPTLALSRTPGVYSFRLVVTDPSGASASDLVQVTVQPEANLAPAAYAGADQTVNAPHDGDPQTASASFTLDGSLSSDPDLDTLSYEWREGSNSLGTTPTLTLTRPAGVYTLVLVAKDPYGASSSDSVQVTVQAEANGAPTATAGPDMKVAVPHDGDPLTATASFTLVGFGSDPDGDPMTYQWSEEDGSPVSSDAVVTLARPAGTYHFVLTVTDAYGATGSSRLTVTVDPEPNGAPTADAGPDQMVKVAHDRDPQTGNAAFTLDGSASSDPDSDPLAYEWSEGSSVVGSGKTLTLARPAGTYQFQLTVKDAYGATATSQVTVRVDPEPNAAPVANAGPDKKVECVGALTPVSVNGGGSSDPDGDALTYAWSEGGKALGSTPTLSVSLPLGRHALTLTVTDPYGASSSDEVVVKVVDTTAPVISGLKVTPGDLGTANHRMVDVTVDYTVSDAGDPAPRCGLSVTSNEPDNGTGDGDTAGDTQVIDAHHVRLRAERSGEGNGRVYTVTITCTDASGNVARRTATVTVSRKGEGGDDTQSARGRNGKGGHDG